VFPSFFTAIVTLKKGWILGGGGAVAPYNFIYSPRAGKWGGGVSVDFGAAPKGKKGLVLGGAQHPLAVSSFSFRRRKGGRKKKNPSSFSIPSPPKK